MERFFVSQLHVGRHRSSGYSAMGEIATIAARTARPAVKASALVVASGGLVAAYAAFILVPAWTAYERIWQKIVAAVLSLYVLAAFVAVGVVLGGVVVWYWDRIAG